MKIGILGTAYNAKDSIEKTLSPWIHARASKLRGHEFKISIVSVPFAEYKDVPGFEEDHETYRMIETTLVYEKIDYLSITPLYQTEAEARTAALNPLLLENCDLIWCVDLQDEFFTKNNIEDMLKFIEVNTFTSWFPVNYKNYVFDEKTRFEDLFQPPRIFRVKTNGYTLENFYFDNDVGYKNDLNGQKIGYKHLPSKKFPDNISVKHLTWLNNEISRKKVIYQNAHFKNGAGCMFSWNEEADCLIFNNDYFTKMGQPFPVLIKD